MEATIRRATESDVPALMALLIEMGDENALQTVSPARVMAKIDQLMESGWIFVAHSNGKIVGSIGLNLQGFWYSDDAFVNDVWIYVRPPYRASRILAHFADLAKDVARELKLPLCVFINSPVDTDRKIRLFRRCFGTQIGGAFWRDDGDSRDGGLQ